MELENFELSADAPSKIYDVSKNDSAIANLVNRILREAIENKISDIHFNRKPITFVRYRDDDF